jgi:hypothetical protein
LIQENSPNEEEEDYFSANFLFTLPPEVWQEIKDLAKLTETTFESVLSQQDSLFEHLSAEITGWKQRCYEFKSRITFLQSDS